LTHYIRVFWDIRQMDEPQPNSFTADTLCAPLEGGQKEFVRARRVFHAVLVEKLETDGALTLEKMKERLFWFHVQLTDTEVDQLVASAARHGVIEPLEKAGPDLEENCQENGGKDQRWIATDRGRDLPNPRGTAFEDFGALMPRAIEQLQRAAGGWLTLLIAALAIAGFSATLGTGGRIVGAATILGFLAIWCYHGVRGERDLAAAAEVWPRFKETQTARWQWQTAKFRSEILMGGSLASAGFFLAALAAWSRVSQALVAIGIVVGLGTGIYFLVRIRPLRNAWLTK
jgi:hypothetical protein